MRRDKYLRAKYGLTLAQFEQMERAQQGRCKICCRPRKAGRRRLNVDHDHKTERVRGLLCYTCNHFMLARGCDYADLHDRAAEYLRSTFDGRNL